MLATLGVTLQDPWSGALVITEMHIVSGVRLLVNAVGAP